ncbi:MAG: hypothetical protein Q8867_06865 [Bacteroidota bacterium]|nr:hypothetical protein [Bacteroidota bacterium]
MDEPSPEIQPKNGQTRIRPVLLTILCVLTLIGSGFNFVSSLIIASFYPTFIVLAESVAKSMNLPGMDVLLSTRPSFYLVTSLFYLMSATGAIQMWKLKKNGFHIYTIAQILLIIAPMYFMRLPIPNVADLLISGTFIFMYSLNLKYMS